MTFYHRLSNLKNSLDRRVRWRDPLIWLFVLIPISTCVATASLVNDIGRPFLQFHVTGDTLTDNRFVDVATPIWWQPIAEGRIRGGDQLLLLNGMPFVDGYEELEAALLREERFISVTIRSGASTTPQTVSIRIAPFELTHFIDLRLPGLLLAIGSYILGMVVFRAQPDNALNRLITLCALSFALGNGMTPISINWISPAAVMLELTRNYGTPIQFVVYIQVAFYVTRIGKARFAKVVFGVLYTYLAIYWFAWTICYAAKAASFAPAIEALWRVLWSATPLLSILRLGWFLWHEKGNPSTFRAQRFAASLLLGTLIALPGALSVTFSILLRDHNATLGLFVSAFDLRYLWVVALALIASAVVRFQEFKTTSALLAVVPILAAAGLGASGTTGLSYLMFRAQTDPQSNFFSPQLPAFIFILILITVGVSRPFWQRLYGQWMYRRPLSIETVQAFGEDLIQYAHTNAPYQIVVSAFAETLELTYTRLWLWKPKTRHQGAFEFLAGTVLEETALRPVLADPVEIMTALSQHDYLRLDNLAEPLPGGLRLLTHDGKSNMLIPLRQGEELFGILELGERRDGDILTVEDLHAVRAAVFQVMLFIFLMREKRRLQYTHNALHDIALGVLSRLSSGLRGVEEGAYSPTGRDILQNMQIDIADTNHYLRDVLANRTSRSTTDLHMLIKRFEAIYHWKVEVLLDPIDDLPASLRWDIYTWLNEALNNIGKHAHASRVQVSIAIKVTGILMKVEDDGVGFDLKHHTANTGQFGLRTIQDAVSKIGGRLEILANYDQGMCLIFYIPIVHEDAVS